MMRAMRFAGVSFVVVGMMASGCTSESDATNAPSNDPSQEDDIKAGTFSCGSEKCKIGQQYCVISGGGPRPLPGQVVSETSSCRALPSRCKTPPTCDSCGLAVAGVGMSCAADGSKLTVHEIRP
jgi:hypothetical protein